jgi:hypothetical protein
MQSASAVHDTGAFQLDGNATTQNPPPGDDWDVVCHQVTGSDCSTTNNTNGASAVDWVSEPNPNASIFTGGGSKDPQDINNWAWKDGAGGLPDKDNLLHSFAARYPSTSQGDVLFFGSDRLDNSGDAQQGFWFFQNQIALGSNSVGGGTGFTGVHKTGDLLLISDFSNGGTTSTITVYKWNPACMKTGQVLPNMHTCGDANLEQLATSSQANCATAASADEFCGLVNSSTITMPWSFTDKSGTPNNGALNGEFYEGGVNLTKLGLAGECFASVASETRSSTSTTATLKDFILGGFGGCQTTLTSHQSNATSPSIGTGTVSSGTDTAALTITGISTWSGTLTWYLCGPVTTDGCDNHGVLVTTRGVSNSSPASDFVSDTANLTSAGRYCWHSHFQPSQASHDAGVAAADDDGTNECFTVNPVTPTLTTSASCSATPCILGSTLSDFAQLSGTASEPGTGGPGGDTGLYKSIYLTAPSGLTKADHSISWTLFGPASDGSAQCTTTKTLSPSSVTVTGDNTIPGYGPVTYTTTAANDGLGVYTFAASYPGDLPNTLAAADVTCANGASNGEQVTVTSTAATTTAQKWLPQDTATVTASGGATLAGTVTFSLYESADCTGSAVQSFGPFTVDSNGQATTNNTTYYTTTKTISWRATFTSSNGVGSGSPSHCETMSVSTLNNDIGS